MMLSRYSKALALVLGFLFTVIGSVWSYIYVDHSNSDLARLREQRADKIKQIESINRAAYDYFIANQQADLIYLVSQATNGTELSSLLLRGNLLDRAAPVRSMIGALAIANQLDYRAKYDEYEGLNDDARKNLDIEKYNKVKSAERTVVQQGQSYAANLQMSMGALDQQIRVIESKSAQQRFLGIVAALFGSLLLLAANLAGLSTAKDNQPIAGK
jgi:cell fate (sporulation/competence/biofilm development) regulator YlbF (YheA/YmcA/DUF963 family)